YALVSALDAREHETSDHSQRVVEYTTAIAQRLSIRGPELDEIGRGALLHDIGKIGVPDAVLLKPGKLTPEEWVDMRKHPGVRYNLIRPVKFLATPPEIVRSHQERWDGQGYPRCLKGPEIHIGARIFSVADTLDAMTSDRPYRKGTTFANAIAEIERCSGTQFDPRVVEAFLAVGEERMIALKQEMAQAKRRPEDAARLMTAETELAAGTDDEQDLRDEVEAELDAPVPLRQAR